MAGDPQQITTVTILDQTYNVVGRYTPEYVRELAHYVDEKMVELMNNTPTVDTLKVAVLTALTLADELLQAKQERRAVEAEIQQRLQNLLAGVEASLSDRSDRERS
jgi:cell division protein ZapA